MKKFSLYIETSVWNFLFADDAQDKKIVTERFFDEVETGKYDIFISETVRAEFMAAPDIKRRMLFDVINRYDPVMLEADEEVYSLAEAYVRNGVLSQKHFRDLLHLAYASVHGMKALISWNQKHIVKMRTYDLVNAINCVQGYHDVQIRTPQEVIDIED